jgi:hypothetical protein
VPPSAEGGNAELETMPEGSPGPDAVVGDLASLLLLLGIEGRDVAPVPL